MNFIEIVLGATAGFIGGGALAYLIWDKALNAKKKRIVAEAQSEGEVVKKDKMLQAKERFLHLKSEHEKYIHEKSANINNLEHQQKQRETRNRPGEHCPARPGNPQVHHRAETGF